MKTIRYGTGAVIMGLAVIGGLSASAQDTTLAEDLYDALAIDGLVEILAEEGTDYGAEMAEDLLPNGMNPGWRSEVAGIYAPERMRGEVLDSLTAELDPVLGAQAVDFFRSDLGVRIITLEMDARRAIMDETVEEMATNIWVAESNEGETRRDLIMSFIEANGILENHVADALNHNFAFMQGLSDADALPQPMSESELLGFVAGQEEEIRSEGLEWIGSYLMLAYSPLSDADIDTYIAFSQTEAGAHFNAVLNRAFNVPYSRISRELGLAAGAEIAGDAI